MIIFDNIYVCGAQDETDTHYDMVVIKYKPNGTEDWKLVYDRGYMQFDMGYDILIDPNGLIVDSGYSMNSLDYDAFIMKLDNPTGSILPVYERSYLGVYPNPSDGKYTLNSNQILDQDYDMYIISSDGSQIIVLFRFL